MGATRFTMHIKTTPAATSPPSFTSQGGYLLQDGVMGVFTPCDLWSYGSEYHRK